MTYGSSHIPVRQVSGGCADVRYAVLGPIENNTYLIDDGQGDTIVVDPSSHAEKLPQALGIDRVSAILVTHNHWDHVSGLAALVRETGAPMYAPRIDAGLIESGQRDHMGGAQACAVTRKLDDGDTVDVGATSWRCIATPGHTPGGMCYYMEPDHAPHGGRPLLLSGDTLFFASIGRTDFEGGDMGQMRASLGTLAKLPDSCIVLPGHNRTTTIADERQRTIEALM